MLRWVPSVIIRAEIHAEVSTVRDYQSWDPRWGEHRPWLSEPRSMLRWAPSVIIRAEIHAEVSIVRDYQSRDPCWGEHRPWLSEPRSMLRWAPSVIIRAEIHAEVSTVRDYQSRDPCWGEHRPWLSEPRSMLRWVPSMIIRAEIHTEVSTVHHCQAKLFEDILLRPHRDVLKVSMWYITGLRPSIVIPKTIIKMVQIASLLSTHAWYEFGSAARLSERPGSVWKCIYIYNRFGTKSCYLKDIMMM